MLGHLDDLYIPQDEHTLRRIQRRAEDLDKRVRAWAESIVHVLPRGLSLHEDESYILSLFLAAQRRLNIELDTQNPEPTLRNRLGRVLPLPFAGDLREDPEILRAMHRTVATRLESDIDRACGFFCRDLNIPPISDPAIDWRVAIRFMAQNLHALAAQVDMRDYHNSPIRFEMSVLARDLAAAVVARRRTMVESFSGEPV